MDQVRFPHSLSAPTFKSIGTPHPWDQAAKVCDDLMFVEVQTIVDRLEMTSGDGSLT